MAISILSRVGRPLAGSLMKPATGGQPVLPVFAVARGSSSIIGAEMRLAGSSTSTPSLSTPANGRDIGGHLFHQHLAVFSCTIWPASADRSIYLYDIIVCADKLDPVHRCNGGGKCGNAGTVIDILQAGDGSRVGVTCGVLKQ